MKNKKRQGYYNRDSNKILWLQEKKLSFLTNDVLGNFMKICQFTIINSNEQG